MYLPGAGKKKAENLQLFPTATCSIGQLSDEVNTLAMFPALDSVGFAGTDPVGPTGPDPVGPPCSCSVFIGVS